MYLSQRRDPDRLLPSEPALRRTARELYDSVSGLPIISPHGHVPARLLAENRPFANAAELFVTHDHYVTRLLHSAGVDLAALGAGGIHFDPREAWRLLASNWHLFAGTASGYWLDEELTGVLGIELEVSAATAGDIYDQVAEQLASPAFLPRVLFEQFGIEFLATTDDPLDELEWHDALRAERAERAERARAEQAARAAG
ncbi:MAG: glucuronate isomerase, partial [Subtercola sp.]|nr:glucuronate isomerase [Subtercola sp.]